MDPSSVSPSATQGNEEKKLTPLKGISESSSSSSSRPGISLPPIRAPPTYDDFDFKTSGAKLVVVGDDSSIGSSSYSSYDESEDGFLSGEDDFETASERPFFADPDEETLGLIMEKEKVVVPFAGGASSSIPSAEITRPKAPVSVDVDESDFVAADEGFVSEVEDDGFADAVRVPIVDGSEKPVGDVEGSTIGVLGNEKREEQEEGKEEEKPSIVPGPVVNSILVENNEREVLGSVDINPSLGLGSEGKEGDDGVSTAMEAAAEAFDLSPENPKSVEVALPVVERLDKEETETEDTPVVEKKVDALVVDQTDTLSSTTGGDSIVETKQPIEVEENGASDIKELEVPVDESRISDDGDNEESVHSKLVEAERDVSPPTEGGEGDSIVETEQPLLLPEATVVEDVKEHEVSEAKQPILLPEVTVVEDVEEDKISETKQPILSSESTVVEDVEEDKISETQQPILSSEATIVKDVEEDKVSETKLPSESTIVEDVEEDKLSEIKQPILLPESNDVENVEEGKVSGDTTVEPVVERSVTMDNGFEQATDAVKEPADPMLVEASANVAKPDRSAGEHDDVEQKLEPAINNLVLEALEPEPHESKSSEAEVNDVKSSVVADGSDYLDSEVPETEPHTDSGAKPDESVLNVNADGVESEPRDEVVSKDETQNIGTGSAINSDVIAAEESKHLEITAQGDESDDVVSGGPSKPEVELHNSVSNAEVKEEAEDEIDADPDFVEEYEGSTSDEEAEGIMFDGSETAEQIMKELERGASFGSHSGGDSSQDRFQRIDGQIVMDSDEDVDTDEEGDGKELFDSAALAALLKAATGAGSDGDNVTITSSDGSRLFSVERPAGLGSSIRSLKPAARQNRPGLFTPSDLAAGGEPEKDLSEEEKMKLEKIHLLRVKFLRLVQRLGHSPEDSIAAQVLYRLVLAAGRHTSQAFSVDAAKRTAMLLEAEGKDDIDFSLNILVLGKIGAGKSATINSIFGEEKASIDPFEPGTTSVKEIIGTVDGVKVRVFDTPGLRSAGMEQASNRRILASVKKLTKKFPPDILLYVDRLDSPTRDLNDLPLLRSITAALGSSIWRSAIVTLTHAASAPPDGPTGAPLSYEMFVAQRSNVVQQSIGQAVGDLRMMNPSLMNPVSLVENHPSCRRNREGHRVLPNGQSWRPQLLLLCYSMKILSEASSLSKPQDPFDHRKLFGFRARAPPLPYLLSSLLQSRPHPKLPSDQGGENVDSDIDLDDLSDSDEEDEDEYDQLPPFKPLRKAQIANLSKDQRKAYFDEYEYRVKLLQKKQWKEELKRMKDMKKGKGLSGEYGLMGEDGDQENGGPAAVQVPLPDMVLPPTFDGDSPAYRYRFLEPSSQLLARPVLDTHGWDHDCGYDGVSLEENLAVASKFPAAVAVQITKDKKEFNIHLDSSIATKHGENGSTLAGFDIQTVGKQLAYVLKGETKFKKVKKHNPAAGVSITFLGENVVTGFKTEDQIAIGKCLVLAGSVGTIRSQGDAAYGANLEARLKQKDFPIEQDQSTLGLSLMRWKGDLAVGANLQSQISIGRSSKVSLRVGLNNKMSGQITVRTSSSEQLQLALVGILPIAISLYRSIWPGSGFHWAHIPCLYDVSSKFLAGNTWVTLTVPLVSPGRKEG